MSGPGEEGGFLSRWARRKAQVQTHVQTHVQTRGAPAEPLPEPVPVEAPKAEGVVAERAPEAAPVAEPAPAPLPTLQDVALLTRESDYARFVAPGVDGGVRNAAMKKLFTDPHFNVMDGLDTYIDDYGKPDPIPESMLRMMRQSSFLGLFDDEKKEVEGVAANLTPDSSTTDPLPPAEPEDLAHEDTDLRLQQDDAAGRPGPGQGPGA